MMPRLLLLLLLAFLGGCIDRQAVIQRLEDSKAPSLAAWEGRTIDNQPPADWLWDHTAITLGGVERFAPAFDGPRTFLVTPDAIPDDSASAGAAAPISNDGYFLTASHCVQRRPFFLIRRVQGGASDIAPARVVWAADRSQGEPDLAIVHIDRWIAEPLRFPDEHVTPDLVLICGSGFTSSRWAAGQGLSTECELICGIPIFTVKHTAPVSHGDSGGPAIDRNGRLLGVNVFVLVPIDAPPTCTAIRPDPAWLERLLSEDRAKRRAPPSQ